MNAIEIIINTKSNRGKAALEEIVRLGHEFGYDIQKVHEVTGADDISDAINSLTPESIVVVAGGDGTVSSAVDYLAGSGRKVAIIPLGTTNNFARSLNLPLEVAGAFEVIKNGHLIDVDLGKLNGDYFSNVAGIGVSAAIASKITNKEKRRWKRMAYAYVGLRELWRHKPFLVSVRDKDSELAMHFETHQLIIANGRYHAGKEIAAEAKLDNRELVIMKLGGKTRLSLLWAMIDFYVGKRKSIKHSSYLIGKHVIVETTPQQSVELDGEMAGMTPAVVDIQPRSIKVYACKK